MSVLLKSQVYASIMEILRRKEYYYQGISANYNSLTDDGINELKKCITIWAPHMIEDENQSLDMRAKQMVIKELER
jgi:hypothetical protein